MIVRCRTNFIPFHIEKRLSGMKMERPVLEVGRDYVVIALYIFPESELLIPHISFVVEVEPYIISPIPREFFGVVDHRIDPSWEYSDTGDGSIGLQPALFNDPYFTEDLADGIAETRARFDRLRRLLSEL